MYSQTSAYKYLTSSWLGSVCYSHYALYHTDHTAYQRMFTTRRRGGYEIFHHTQSRPVERPSGKFETTAKRREWLYLQGASCENAFASLLSPCLL